MGNKDGKSVKRFLSNIYPVDKPLIHNTVDWVAIKYICLYRA